MAKAKKQRLYAIRDSWDLYPSKEDLLDAVDCGIDQELEVDIFEIVQSCVISQKLVITEVTKPKKKGKK